MLDAGLNTYWGSRTQQRLHQSTHCGEFVVMTSIYVLVRRRYKPVLLCSGLWGLIGTGLFTVTSTSECNLHKAFEGLCYCMLRLPPMVSLSPPTADEPSLHGVISELGGENGCTDCWLPDNHRNIPRQCICTLWASLCHPDWPFCLGGVKVQVSLLPSIQHHAICFKKYMCCIVLEGVAV